MTHSLRIPATSLVPSTALSGRTNIRVRTLCSAIARSAGGRVTRLDVTATAGILADGHWSNRYEPADVPHCVTRITHLFFRSSSVLVLPSTDMVLVPEILMPRFVNPASANTPYLYVSTKSSSGETAANTLTKPLL